MSNNPFGNFDLNSIFKNMQGNPVTDTMESNPFFKSVSDAFFKPQQPKDLGELWAMQKKNIDVLMDADANMSEKMTKLASQQMEVFQEAWKTYEHYANKAAKGENVDKGAMQTAQNAMLKAMNNMQELGEKNTKMSVDAADDLQKRMADSVGELSSLLKNSADRKPKMDALELTQSLIRCPSVTPEEGGALSLLQDLLNDAGFTTRRVDRNGIPNLYARFGEAEPVLCFNGHTDVVPVGDEAAWKYPPFGAEIDGEKLYGRGACDMKSGVAAFVTAAIEFVQKPFQGSIILLITGDEEGAGRDGTLALLDDLKSRGEILNHAIVGEPTSPNFMGEMIKIGRRGSFTAYLEAEGKQGHVAYPDRALNPMPAMIALLNDLQNWQLDEGYEDFQPSNLEVVTVDVGNSVNNVIPAKVTATANIRYNPNHNAHSLENDINNFISKYNDEIKISVKYHASGDAFLTRQGDFTNLVAKMVEKVTGNIPDLSTTGGTSDARFIKDFCPVVECGLVGSSMHAVDEFVTVEEIHQLTRIYAGILQNYF